MDPAVEAVLAASNEVRHAASNIVCFPGEVDKLDIRVKALQNVLRSHGTGAGAGGAEILEAWQGHLPATEEVLKTASELLRSVAKPRVFYWNYGRIVESFFDLNDAISAQQLELQSLAGAVKFRFQHDESKAALDDEEELRQSLVHDAAEAKLRTLAGELILKWLTASTERRLELSRWYERNMRKHFLYNKVIGSARKISRKATDSVVQGERRVRRLLQRTGRDARLNLQRIRNGIEEERASESLGQGEGLLVTNFEGLDEGDAPERHDDVNADIEAKKERFLDEDGGAMLWMACFTGNTKQVERLLAEGVATDSTCPEADEVVRNPKAYVEFVGTTPFLVACMKGHVDIVQLLLDAGADPGVCMPDGTTGADVALRNGFGDLCDILNEASTMSQRF